MYNNGAPAEWGKNSAKNTGAVPTVWILLQNGVERQNQSHGMMAGWCTSGIWTEGNERKSVECYIEMGSVEIGNHMEQGPERQRKRVEAERHAPGNPQNNVAEDNSNGWIRLNLADIRQKHTEDFCATGQRSKFDMQADSGQMQNRRTNLGKSKSMPQDVERLSTMHAEYMLSQTQNSWRGMQEDSSSSRTE
ncbi:hypothetical protein C8R44DRAFT_729231 [Mycena epipterygia]|nr:hypothetical protein C8R44DRAFT_729231 [Mycena epipterygia]